MTGEKTEKQNRVREALGRLYEEYPPYFREYLRRYEEDPTSRVFAPLAEAYRKLGRLDDAIQICHEGLSHHPEFHGGRVALAKCLMEKGDMGTARVELERVIRVAPENLLAQRLMGDVSRALGDSITALHAYKMALLLAPTDVALAEKVHELEHAAAVFMHSGGIATDGNGPVPASPPSSVAATKSASPSEDPVPPIWSQSQQRSDGDLPPLWETQSEASQQSDFGQEHSASGLQPIHASDSEGTDVFLGNEPSISSVPIDELIGDDESVDDEAFKIGHLSSIFEADLERKREITTETLGDLYFSQGQFERALRIFDKLTRTPEVLRKVRDCKLRLGVDENQLHRSRQLALLRKIMDKAQNASGKR
jgi:tetratricopeptide (TPR) repeat protein